MKYIYLLDSNVTFHYLILLKLQIIKLSMNFRCSLIFSFLSENCSPLWRFWDWATLVSSHCRKIKQKIKDKKQKTKNNKQQTTNNKQNKQNKKKEILFFKYLIKIAAMNVHYANENIIWFLWSCFKTPFVVT